MNQALTQRGFIEYFERDGIFYAVECGMTFEVTPGSPYFLTALELAVSHPEYKKLKQRYEAGNDLVFGFLHEYLSGWNDTPDVTNGIQTDSDGTKTEINGHIISPRELDLIRCANEGLADKQIADRLTPIDALNRFGCFRLGARIWDLKNQGHNIKSEMKKVGDRKRVAEYSL